MADIDFIELANYCQNRYKENNNKYINTLFVSITKEGNVITSTTPHILINAERCILMHTCSDPHRHKSYEFEFINEDGVVNGQFDENFSLAQGSKCINLYYKSISIYSMIGNYEYNIVKAYQLYSRVKNIKSSEEIFLIAKLFQKDEKILELEKQIENFKFTNYLLEQERNQYKSLLDDIAKMVENK